MSKAGFKQANLLLTILLTLFILALIFEIVTHTDLISLVTNILSSEIQFAIRLSLLTSVASTFLCILIAIPVSYALARYDFHGKVLILSLIHI